MIKLPYLFIFIVMLLSQQVSASDTFRFHLMHEPHSLDPSQIRGSAGSFLFSNLYVAPFKYSDDKGLEPNGFTKCKKTQALKLICELNKALKWNDGTPVLSHDYVTKYKDLFAQDNKNTATKFLLKIKNARQILKGKKLPHLLGIKALSNWEIEFTFETPDLEFQYKLVQSSLSATKYNKQKKPLTNGIYQIKKWRRGKSLLLEPNKFHPQFHVELPLVEVLFIEEDITAYNLYTKGKINFLRRVSTDMVPKLRNHKDFFFKPIFRFDYLGFGVGLQDYPNLRKALSLSLNYKELQKLYSSLGIPGCPSFPVSYMDQKTCYTFNLNEAKKAFKKVPLHAKKRKWNLAFSKVGGASVQSGMEWAQAQWKKHLGIIINLQPIEAGMLVYTIKNKKPDIFRKGTTLSRPTCMAATENFTSKAPENYIHHKNNNYDQLVNSLASSKTPKVSCRRAVSSLLRSYPLIPLGEIHFAMMADRQFSGFKINRLNQLDLSGLRKSVSN